jgi:hypothetical protein
VAFLKAIEPSGALSHVYRPLNKNKSRQGSMISWIYDHLIYQEREYAKYMPVYAKKHVVFG